MLLLFGIIWGGGGGGSDIDGFVQVQYLQCIRNGDTTVLH